MQLHDIQVIRPRYDHVYISPHFDDVVASCGGQILKQKQRNESILVVTVFSARGHHYPDANSSALKTRLDYDRRRSEDRKVMQQLGIDYLWLEYPEILFRHQSPWRRYWPTYPATTANQKLCCQVANSLNEIRVRTQCVNMILPLGIGQHVDHQIVLRAGLSLQCRKPHLLPVSFYEELPYALFPFLLIYRLKRTGLWQAMALPAIKHRISNQSINTKTLAQFLISLPSLGMDRKCLHSGLSVLLKGMNIVAHYFVQPRQAVFGNHPVMATVEDISQQIDPKLDLISAYSSQLASPRLSRRNIRKALAAYGMILGLSEGRFGERYWHIQ